MLRSEWGFQGMVVTDSAMGNTSWMDVNLAIRAGGDMMLCLMGVTLDSSSNTAQQAMRTACHNILYTQANSIAVAAAVDTTPYWLILLAVVDILLLAAIVLMVLARIPLGAKLGKGAKAGIVAGIAAVVAVLFWALFFRAAAAPVPQRAEAAASTASGEATQEPQAEPAATEPAAQMEGLLVELLQTDAGGWLGCHVYLMQDGSYTVAYDYGGENMGISAGGGSYTDNGDGTLTLTPESRDTLSGTVTDNGDGTKTYTVEITEANTDILCTPTGVL